ncbi:hypothetical protein SAPIO_CDS10744 [Scedosporium apiospermum]|uniref:Rhodopsin domain-containing protein n=1 Tax=Pseudallescheria apiosperma TaxID=563466 RepID=A0A084FUF6_PSEDA|nr:uncharacterized protein SAPIO_CDS10744 [Scedosporium apiospermum]KEZ38718.1 hypothetical protein SAPIO_CDS10744 [Scedosporium apiospermum]
MSDTIGEEPSSGATAKASSFTGIVAQPQLPHNEVVTELKVIIWILIGLASVFFTLRIYCKKSRGRNLWWDDYMLLISWLAILTSGSLITVAAGYGFGKHIYDFPNATFADLLFTLNLSGSFSTLSAAWSKTSFAFTLLRISDSGRVRKFIWFVIISVNVTMHTAAILMWLQCTPVARTSNPWIEGTCWNKWVIVIFNSVVSAYSGMADISLAVLPWKIIRRNTMNYKERIGMLVCMSMGVFAGLTSLAKTPTFPAMADSDMINTVPLVILGVAECAVTIMAASIPVLRALLRVNRLPNASEITQGRIPTPTTGSTLGWQDEEAFAKELESYSPVKISMSRTPTSTTGRSWRI